MFNNKFTKKDPIADAALKILESWDDDEDDDVRRADAELKRMKAKPIEADKKTDPDKEIGKLAKKTPKEVDESVEQIDEISKKTLSRYISKSRDDLQTANARGYRDYDDEEMDSKDSDRSSKRQSGIDLARAKMNKSGKSSGVTSKIKASESVDEDKWTDIADGPWKKSKLKTTQQRASAAANAAGKGLKGAQHKLDVAKPKGKLTAADFKKLRKEESEQIDEISGELATRYKKKALGGKSYDDDSWNELSRKRQKGIGLANRKVTQSLHPHNPEKHAKVPVTWKEESELSEKTLTPAESKKKEEIVKSMKKGASGFKERYGKRAKEVMYATATKQAKKVAEEIESVDEKVKVKVSTDKPIGYKVSDIGPGKKEHNVKTNKAWDDAQKKKTVSEAQGPTSTYSSDTFVQNANTSSNPSPLSRAKELARSAMSRMKNEMLGKAGTTSEEIDPNVRSTDTLKGRVAGGKKDVVGPGSDGKSSKVKYTPGPK